MLETEVNFVNRSNKIVSLRKKLGENMCWVEHNGDLSVGQLEELQQSPRRPARDLQSAAKKVIFNGDWHCWRQQQFQNSYLKEREI